jgi:hypothetical protein
MQENTCPKQCCEKDWTIEDKNWAIVSSYKYLYFTENRLLCSFNSLLGDYLYGYKKDCGEPKKIDKELQTRNVIKRELYRLHHDKHCLCKEDYKTLFSKVERFEKCKLSASLQTKEEIKDWVRKNPLCASREDWEMFASNLCALWNLEITLQKSKTDSECNIALEITLSKEFCDIMLALSISRAACEINLKPKIEKEQCKIEWELLLEKHPQCDISLKTYIECKEVGMTYDILDLILQSGFDLQSQNGELFLKGLLQEYRLNDLSFKGIPANTEDTKHFYDDPRAFVDRYLKDYHIPQIIIDKLLNKS